MICQYCGKECKNSNSLKNHERLCKLNPNREISNWVNYNNDKNAKHSNRYIKAKEEGKIIEISEELKYKFGNGFRNKHHSDETKQKISESYKKYLKENPNKIGWIINHSSKKSYPEQYFEELFINEGIPLKYHKQIGRYELDFYNEELKKYVEIDGEQHYTDKMIQHDKERNEYLLNLGWNGLRIRWSEYKKLSEKEKEDKIQEVKTFLFS